jgi:hypothetical protein
MLNTVWAVVREGRIELAESVDLVEGARVLVTLLPPEEEGPFWLHASQASLAQVWDNPQDDVYGELLEK